MTPGNCSRILLAGLVMLSVRAAAAPGSLASGPQAGQRPLPFTSNMVTGANRGKQYCYICELKDEPAVLVFARRTDEATARLLRELRNAVRDGRKDRLFAWMVFLGGEDTPSETVLERQAYEFAKDNGATGIPISALGDPAGPPGYRIALDAEVTVIGFRSGKVRFNRAYRAGEWSARAASGALQDLPKLMDPKP